MNRPLLSGLVRRLIPVLCTLALAGCSSFEPRWQEAARTAPRDAFSGAWEGRWTSATHRTPSGNAMGGQLRCIFTREDPTHYHARFKARWLVFSSSYATTFAVERRGGILHFRGKQDLGRLYGGIYRYSGEVRPTRFDATYDSSYDRGVFRLQRPGEVPSRRGD